MKALSFLDLVIGMVFIYLIFSIACSTLWEMVANLRNLRGKMLRNWFLRNFRRGEDTSSGEKILSHPLIRGLEGPSGKSPAYISPRIFAEVITDLVLHDKPTPQDEPEKAADIRTLREKLSVTNLLPDAMQRVFVQHAEECEGVRGVKKGFGEWYGEVQVQLTAAYKRKVQRWILAIAVALVVAVNADTFRLASWLWTSEESRVALVKDARGFLADEQVARQVEAIRTTQENPMASQAERKSAKEIINSDQGSQFTWPLWIEYLQKTDIKISIDGKVVRSITSSLNDYGARSNMTVCSSNVRKTDWNSIRCCGNRLP